MHRGGSHRPQPFQNSRSRSRLAPSRPVHGRATARRHASPPRSLSTAVAFLRRHPLPTRLSHLHPRPPPLRSVPLPPLAIGPQPFHRSPPPRSRARRHLPVPRPRRRPQRPGPRPQPKLPVPRLPLHCLRSVVPRDRARLRRVRRRTRPGAPRLLRRCGAPARRCAGDPRRLTLDRGLREGRHPLRHSNQDRWPAPLVLLGDPCAGQDFLFN